MKSFTTNTTGAGKLAKIQNDLGKTVRYTVSICSLMAMTAFGSELHAQNNAPTDVVLTSTDINELQPAGTAVGFLSSVDPDAGDTFTYSLVAGIGDDDNASFSIFLNKLQSGASFDYVTKSSYNVRIATTDGGGLSFEKAYTINIKHLPPVVSNIVDVVVTGQVHSFAATEFTGAFTVPNGMTLNTLKVIDLPLYGELDLNGTPVNAGDILLPSDLDNLTFAAPSSFAGPVSFNWNAADMLGSYADADAKVKLNVKRTRTIGDAIDANGLAAAVLNTQPGGTGANRPGVESSGDLLTTAGTPGIGSGATRPGGPIDPNSLNRLGNTGQNASIAGIEENNTAHDVLIHNCYPNPFSQGATIKYQLPNDGKVEIKVYNSVGVEIKTLLNESQTAGVHSAEWSGKNNNGLPTSAGQYYYFINVNDASGKQVSTNSGVMVKM